jgi:glutamyl-tRNA reductase
VSEVLVVNRTLTRAQALAERFGGQAVTFEQLHQVLPQADIVITSTGSPKPIFRKEHGEQLMQARRNKPVFFIDIAVPRDVSPEMNEVDGVFVYDIDDLQQAVAANKADRTREAERAEAIVSAEVTRFRERLRELNVVPVIVSLQDSMEMLRQAELERVRARLGQLTPEQEQAIEALTRGIVNKVLHTPIVALKSAAKSDHAESLVEVIDHLFNLNREKKSEKGEKRREAIRA